MVSDNLHRFSKFSLITLILLDINQVVTIPENLEESGEFHFAQKGWGKVREIFQIVNDKYFW